MPSIWVLVNRKFSVKNYFQYLIIVSFDIVVKLFYYCLKERKKGLNIPSPDHCFNFIFIKSTISFNSSLEKFSFTFDFFTSINLLTLSIKLGI